MGRNKKVSVTQVLDLFINQGQITIADVAAYFDVTPATIRARLRELREGGEPIIHDRNGLFLLDKEDLEEADVARALRRYIEWSLAIFQGIMICLKPTRGFLPKLRRTLRDALDVDERRELGRDCLKVKALLDYVEAEEEDDDDENK